MSEDYTIRRFTVEDFYKKKVSFSDTFIYKPKNEVDWFIGTISDFNNDGGDEDYIVFVAPRSLKEYSSRSANERRFELSQMKEMEMFVMVDSE